MKRWFLHSMVCLLAFIGVACSDDAGNMPMDNAGNVRLRLQLALPAGGGVSRAESSFENGVELENYIDFNDEDQYRIYFFDSENNKFIARFMPTVVDMSLENQYILYQVEGDVPEELMPQSETMNFKIVVLGNWDTYQEPVAGETTIKQLCEADWATFDCFTDGFTLSKPDKLIPFYGVHEYKGITFKDEDIVILAAPVTLLRAMAKVEVLLDEGDWEFESVTLCRYNSKGYCAPKDVDSQDDYGQGDNLATDYLSSLHLVNDANDTNEKELPLTKISNASSGVKGTWVAYLPEYQNKGVGNNYSYIKVKVSGEETDRTIYFATYTNGETDNADVNRMDIQRNNIYRFRVHANPLLFQVSVDKWEFGGKVHIDMK